MRRERVRQPCVLVDQLRGRQWVFPCVPVVRVKVPVVEAPGVALEGVEEEREAEVDSEPFVAFAGEDAPLEFAQQVPLGLPDAPLEEVVELVGEDPGEGGLAVEGGGGVADWGHAEGFVAAGVGGALEEELVRCPEFQGVPDD